MVASDGCFNIYGEEVCIFLFSSVVGLDLFSAPGTGGTVMRLRHGPVGGVLYVCVGVGGWVSVLSF